jgi:hypothetical protein
MAMTIDKYQVLDPKELALGLRDRGRPIDRWWGKANVARAVVGREPGGAILLMLRDDVRSLTSDHELKVTDNEKKTWTFKKLCVVRSEQVDPSHDTNSTAPYLVELADPRVHFRNSTVNRAFNMRSGDGADEYQSETLDASSAPWSWGSLCEKLWEALPGGYAWPGLPFTPHGRPENWAFYASNAWDALCDVLDKIQCGVWYNPEAATFRIVKLGDTTQAKPETKDRIWDADPTNPKRAWLPAKIVVYFRRQNPPPDGKSPFWEKEVSTPTSVSSGVSIVAGTAFGIHDDLVAVGPQPADPTNDSALQARAEQRANDYIQSRDKFGSFDLVAYRRLIGLPKPGLIGSSVGEIRVYDRGEGIVTEIGSGITPVWSPEADISISGGGGGGWFLARITGGSEPYSWVKIRLKPDKTWEDVAADFGTLNAIRSPSAGFVPPAIPIDQAVLIRPSPDVTDPPLYELTPWGGQLRVIRWDLLDVVPECTSNGIRFKRYFEPRRVFARDLQMTCGAITDVETGLGGPP